MKLLACIATGIIATLLLVVGIGTAENNVFSNETNSTCEACNLSLDGNTSQEDTGMAENETGEFTQPIPEDEGFFSGNGDDTLTLPAIDEAFLDLQVIKTTRVSVRTNGKQGNDNSKYPSISSDSRYVAFESVATNLVNKDTNGVSDVFVRDRQTGKTTRVSVRTNGKQGDDVSLRPSISSDGRYVAFWSAATNLVNKDTNGVSDIFVRDRQTGKTTRVSVRTNGKQGNGNSRYPSISSDGRYVAFESDATNLVNGDTNGKTDIFVRDRESGKTTRVSINSKGNQAKNGNSYSPVISSDGRYVAFWSRATNLVKGDTNGRSDVFVHDRETGKTRRMSVRTNGVQGDDGSYYPSITSDGRYVAFYSGATNLVNGDTNGVYDIFVHDRETGKTSRVSVDTNGKQANDYSEFPSISLDGSYVAFHSAATNLVNKDTNGVYDIFVHERQTGEIGRVSVRTNGVQGDDNSFYPSISSDGMYVAFQSSATNLVNGDTNGKVDIFVTELNI